MLLGEYQHSIDAKGRVAIPARLRDELGTLAFITGSTDEVCLKVYPKAMFETLAAKVFNLDDKSDENRADKRNTFSQAEPVNLDGQGRILISTKKLEEVNLTSECTIIGNYDHLEIWNCDAWKKYYAEKIKKSV